MREKDVAIGLSERLHPFFELSVRGMEASVDSHGSDVQAISAAIPIMSGHCRKRRLFPYTCVDHERRVQREPARWS
jgi:hypothetical protein